MLHPDRPVLDHHVSLAVVLMCIAACISWLTSNVTTCILFAMAQYVKTRLQDLILGRKYAMKYPAVFCVSNVLFRGCALLWTPVLNLSLLFDLARSCSVSLYLDVADIRHSDFSCALNFLLKHPE